MDTTNLKEWLTSFGGLGNLKMTEIGLLPFLAIMVLSLLCSLFILFLYLKFYKSRATGSHVHWAFPLLGISITAIFITIQFSLPLSLGLLGALSIVRFRTPVKEPEEIGFIMLVIASSLCIATFNLFFLGVLLFVSVLALFILQGGRAIFKGGMNDGMFILTLPAAEYRDKARELMELLEKTLPRGRFDSISESGEESILSYSFIKLDQNTLLELQADLKKIAAGVRTNTYFNRSGEV